MAAMRESDAEASEDDDFFMDKADSYGTPPTRQSYMRSAKSKTPPGYKPDVRRKPKTRHSHKAVSHGTKMSASDRKESKERRDKARLQARAYKEIDTTLEVLGITAEEHDSDVQRASTMGSIASTRSMSSPTTPTTRTSSAASTPGGSHPPAHPSPFSPFQLNHHLKHVHSSPHLREQPERGQAPAGPMDQKAAAPPFGGRRCSSSKSLVQRESSEGSGALSVVHASTAPELNRQALQADRQEWAAGLESVLSGAQWGMGVEDAAGAKREATNQLKLLARSIREAREASQGVAHNLQLLKEFKKHTGRTLRDVPANLRGDDVVSKQLAQLWDELAAFAMQCADQVGDLLASPGRSVQDVQPCFETATEAVTQFARIAALSSSWGAGEAAEGEQDSVAAVMADLAVEVVGAAAKGVELRQSQLLDPAALVDATTWGARFGSAHAVSDAVALVRRMWQWVSELLRVVEKQPAWERAALLAGSRVAQCFIRAADCACRMQSAAAGLDSNSSVAVGASVWGVPQRGGGRATHDDDVLHQAWVPEQVSSLLAWAAHCHNHLQKRLVAHGAAHLEEEEDAEILAQLDLMQGVFHTMVVVSAKRLAALAGGGLGTLACWALEKLIDGCICVLRMVQRYDQSTLGLGEMLKHPDKYPDGPKLFQMMKEPTEELTNGILAARRLLKQKSAPPAPLNTRTLPGRIRTKRAPLPQQSPPAPPLGKPIPTPFTHPPPDAALLPHPPAPAPAAAPSNGTSTSSASTPTSPARPGPTPPAPRSPAPGTPPSDQIFASTGGFFAALASSSPSSSTGQASPQSLSFEFPAPLPGHSPNVSWQRPGMPQGPPPQPPPLPFHRPPAAPPGRPPPHRLPRHHRPRGHRHRRRPPPHPSPRPPALFPPPNHPPDRRIRLPPGRQRLADHQALQQDPP